MDVPTLEQIKVNLAEPDDAKVDIVTRMRALFYARHYDNPEAIVALKEALKHHSVLLRHEVAYVMGQMTQPTALPVLIDLLDNTEEHPMVRHEAAEGIAALGLTSPEAFEAIQRHMNDSNVAVAETCYLAFKGLQRTLEKEIRLGKKNAKPSWDPAKGFYIFTASKRQETNAAMGTDCERIEKLDKSTFGTCDPAEGDLAMQRQECVAELRNILLDEKADLWDRYIAMFTLRNVATEQAAQALADALEENKSALLRHEICFVLGQLQIPAGLDKLIARLEDIYEAGMVRHEAALALGSVGADIWTDRGREARKQAIAVLQKWSTDPEPVVAESCVVGLSNIEWETGSINPEACC
eukprot:Gregarina_sp_Poly_1__389@NODE_1097_length_5104_cov_220_281318_g761_i0_p1_GENE_NODE_1097_length_5104_cov_220_281318_g761_i0NODE_1097_length_5104_cov_220_281318_g761_i0_p1_ORF_typecomplete_len354_score69_90HEAT_2/PF13646_6/5_8e15HEAT_2/PF13646_6/3HEAT_2/PF13646_6/1e12HEAT_PBS/PF03130_16/29HEAT_PBS/PF03130_16/0_93HEAT_PBS/PF03130_16/0_21HEAT_PBS/PF03130_16/0_2HEAT_PBS/PF03130_16/1_7e02HEAT_PBS/PF03130_16/0_034HEAT/PF02985_22/5_4e03HEAT/PF02985_22/0_37HEAT/PF02985_22/31HEAT/PF02985_22/2_7e02HEAT_EZ/